MVDGGPTNSGVQSSSSSAYKNEFYIVDHNTRVNLANVPLQALSRKTKDQLSQLLNGVKILPSEEGFLRDWRGLASCAKLKSEVVTMLAAGTDPTRGLLDLWAKQSSGGGINLADLQSYLGQIDRWDVVDDINMCFLADAEEYLNLLKQKQLVVSLPSKSRNGDNCTADEEKEEPILTEDDAKLAQRGLPPQQYHAFVLYADEDVEFAAELIERMEGAGLKLCEKSRDLLGGTPNSHDAILSLIRERCNRLIVIVSPAFLESHANTFFMTYAQALGIEQRRRKIVPCIYKRCILPPQLNFYFSLHYENRGKLFNFWDKLEQSIQSPENYNMPMSVGVVSPKITITEVDSVTHTEIVRKAGPQMFPPAPKLRSGSSMFDLTAVGQVNHISNTATTTASKSATDKKSPSLLSRFRSDDKHKSKSFWDLSPSKSTNSLKPTTMENGDANLRSPISPVSPITNIAAPTSSTGKKEKWYKSIITPRTREKKKNKLTPGDLTPSSTRSFESELFLAPEAEVLKKKKKRKLWALA